MSTYTNSRDAIAAALGCASDEATIATALTARATRARGSVPGVTDANNLAINGGNHDGGNVVQLLTLLAQMYQAEANETPRQSDLVARSNQALALAAAWLAP